jgi:alkylhydroperoxidase/carboxymuconolactone decarboxylase family protein YurZ
MTPTQSARPVTIAHLVEHGRAVGGAIGRLVEAAYDESVLDPRTRELILIAVHSAVKMPAGIVAHVQRALDAGCRREEIIDAVMLAAINGGINGALEGLPAALAELDRIETAVESNTRRTTTGESVGL